MAIQFAQLLESLVAAPLILRHGPSAVEVMDKSILDHTRKSAALEAMRQSFIEGDPASLLCVEFYDDREENLPPRLQALERDLREHNLAIAITTRSTSPRRPASGVFARRASGCRWRCATTQSRCRSSATAVSPERLRDYIERSRSSPGTALLPASTRMRRSAVCTCGRSST